MITKNDILIKLKELKPILHKEYAVKEIGLFGSFSDETFNDESDIDILVELERPIGWKSCTSHGEPKKPSTRSMEDPKWIFNVISLSAPLIIFAVEKANASPR